MTRLLSLISLILLLFVGSEVLLELRAIHKGWNGFWLDSLESMIKYRGSKKNSGNNSEPEIYSITRSPYVSKKRVRENRPLRIVVLGTSHSADTRLPLEDLWPNQMANRLQEIGKADSIPKLARIEMINASWAGLSLRSSFQVLKWVLKEYQPDVVIIYQMSNSINEYSRLIQAGTVDNTLEKTEGEISLIDETESRLKNRSLTSMLGISPLIQQVFGKTTVYEHLKSTIGTKVVDFMYKTDSLGSFGKILYKHDIERYIALCKKYDIQLYLTHFLTAVEFDSSFTLAYRYIKSCFRYNSLLSVQGWKNTIHRFNEINHELAKRDGVNFISATQIMTDRQKYFRDIVHFTKAGHRMFGTCMAESFAESYSHNQ